MSKQGVDVSPTRDWTADITGTLKKRLAVEITGTCSCHGGYKGRGLIDPGCMFHHIGEEIQELLDEIHRLRGDKP